MNSNINIDIAKSLMLARWRQTLVAAIGVTFSITMFITLLSFMGGLNKLLDGLILNRIPSVRIHNEIKRNPNQPVYLSDDYKNSYNFINNVKTGASREELYNSSSILDALKRDDRVLGVSTRLIAQVFFNEVAVEITGIINGINVREETKYFHFKDYVSSGNAIDLERVSNSIILGSGVAEKLLAKIGDVVNITNSKGELFSLKVVGIFQSGIQEFDKLQSYADVSTVQKILGKPSSYITDIQVKLKDVNEAPAAAAEYRKLFEVDAEDIQTANSQFETGSSIRTLISYAVGITLLVVSGFGIYNILNMMIYEKMDSIAILKATGFSGRDVKRIFLIIALAIGFFGGLAGLIAGLGLSSIITQIPFNTPSLPTVKTYPIEFNPVFYIIGIVFSLLTTYLAGYFPARKASKIDPVIIIRGK